jgi:hypothetical protein
VPNANIVFGGSGANRTVTVTPAAGQTGTATITVTVSDSQLNTPTSFQLTVNSSNTAPTITTIANQTVNEDSATSALAFTVGDAETAAGSLTVSGTSSNTSLVPNANIVFGGTGANRTVTVTPALNQSGTATITVTVSDGQLITPTSFVLTVNAVNDAPTITTIANQTTTTGTAVGPLAFTVGDAETAAGSLTVSSSSSNTSLVPNANIVFGGSGANRTVTVTPAAGQTGTATITVMVSDGQLNTPTNFLLTVNNAPSTAGLVAAYSFNAGSGTTVSDSSGNNNTGTLGSGITWTTQGKNGSALVFNGSSLVTVSDTASLNFTAGMTLEAWVYPTVTLSGWKGVIIKEGTSQFSYFLYANANANNQAGMVNVGGERIVYGGSALAVNTWTHLAATYDGAMLRLYVNGVQIAAQSQSGAIGVFAGPLRIGGNASLGEYFQGRIDEVRVYNRALTQAEIQTDMNTPIGNTTNTAPTITAIANQTTTSGVSVGPLAFTVGDAEAAAGSLTVSGTSSNTSLVPNANIVFGGSGANRTVTVTPAAGQTGTANITVTVSDGQLNTPTSFQLTVNSSNTAPTITTIANQTVNEDSATNALAFTVGDVETAAGSLTVSGSSTNTTLVPNGNIVFGGSGANRAVTVTPAANQFGTTTITVAVSDGQLSTPTSFLLTVNAINDAPTITAIANQTTVSGTAVGPLAFTVGDVETAAGSLTVNGTSSNTTLVPNANISFGGTGANRTVMVTPSAGQSGTATITVTVNDSQASTPTSFLFTVNAATSGLVAAYSFNEGSGTTLTDLSGNNNNGTISGATWTTAGKYGNALVFNGTNARVSIPSSASLNVTTAMTLQAWIMPTATQSGWRTIMQRQADAYFLNASNSNGPLLPSGGGTFSGTTAFVSGTTANPVSAWTHVALTYDGSTLRLYVNGTQAASQARTGTIQTTTNPLWIGGNNPYGEYFQGRIDEVRVYNRALTQAEIQTDMNTPIGNTPPGDTTPPSVAINAPLGGASVFGLVSISAIASDNAGVAGVQFYVDGQPLGIEVTSSPYSVWWNSNNNLGNHVFTAVARDLSNNTSTSAPVSVAVVAATTDRVGQWSSVSNWPLVAIHAILLPTGNVLAFDGADQNGAAYIWNPTTNSFTSRNAADNIFCAGHCLLPDGRVLVVGGHIANWVGITDANIFNPNTANWTQIPSMNHGRWYPTAVNLPDGRVLVVAGDSNCRGCWVPIPEIYNPSTNTWVQLNSAFNPLPEYPHLFVLSDGRVVAVGAFEVPIAAQVLDLNTQTWTTVDPAVHDGHSSVMYARDMLMKSGTVADSVPPFWPAEATTYVLDMTQAQPSWRETPPMAFARAYHNLTILPDGNVLATGGGVTTDTFDQSQAVFAAEYWSPTTETWTVMASMSVPRLYHSTALLIPDGRVLVAGAGRFGGDAADDQLSAQIYSPPYLFKGTRPTITSAPSLISYNNAFSVSTPSAGTIAKVTMLRLGSVTHHFNVGQRFLNLSFQVAGSNLTVQPPANSNLAQPGHYMLFIVNTNGVPSVASILRLQ